MSLRVVWVLVSVSALLVALAVGSHTEAAEPPGRFTECAFVPTLWMTGMAPEGVPKKYEGPTAVPEGWTVVSGAMSTAPAMLVCR